MPKQARHCVHLFKDKVYTMGWGGIGPILVIGSILGSSDRFVCEIVLPELRFRDRYNTETLGQLPFLRFLK